MITNRKHALIAGIAILVMAVAAGFSFGYTHSTLVVPQNINKTVNNLRSSISLFQLEIIGWMVILICDVLVAWALYKYFRNENKTISSFMGWSRLIYSAILAVAIFKLVQVSTLLDDVTVVPDEIMSFLTSFETIWSLGLIIFGFHLVSLGVLAILSDNIHYGFGILLVFAGVCYSVIHAAKQFAPDYETQIHIMENILSTPMALAEIGFAIWLIVKGGKIK